MVDKRNEMTLAPKESSVFITRKSLGGRGCPLRGQMFCTVCCVEILVCVCVCGCMMSCVWCVGVLLFSGMVCRCSAISRCGVCASVV